MRPPAHPRIHPHDPCPVRRRLAVRQRPAPHRPRRRFRRALRRLQPLHADGRARRAHGVRHRRARHADPGGRRPGGRDRHATSPTRTTRSSCRTSSTSACPTTCSPAPRPATTTGWCRRCSAPCHRNGYMVEQTTQAAISPSTGRTLPDRYIEGTCPICKYADARGDQCDNCGNQLDPTDLIDPRSQDQRRDAGVRRHPALLPRPAGARRRAGGVARRARGVRHLAAQRHQVHPEHPRGDPAAGDDAATSTGASRCRAGRTSRPSGSTSGSTRSSATCPPRSSGPAGSASPSAGASGGTTRVAVLLLHGQGQHRLPLPDLARGAAGVRRQGRPRRRAGGVRRAQPADRGGLLRVPHDGRHPVLHQPRPRHPRRRLPGALRPRRAALLHLRGRPRDLDADFTWARVRHPQQLRAGRGLGQPGQPHRHDDREELRRDPAVPRPRAGRRGGAGRRARAASRRSATCSATTGCAPASPRRCAWSAR